MVSAIILTRNSEKILERCLRSLTWCNERIVIDDYSTDRTESTAKKFHAKVFKRHLNGDFAAQRNFGMEKASWEWVLFIDSDEEVSPELASEIKGTTLLTDKNGFHIRRLDTIFGKTLRYGETGHIKLLRLARKNTGSFVRPVHEEWKVSGKTGELRNPLYHYPHQSISEFVRDIDVYSTLNARYFFAQGHRSSIVQILCYPVGKFIINYIVRLGFLDGTEGFIMAMLMSFHSFLTRSKLFSLEQHEKQD